jgi:hypothetical protein
MILNVEKTHISFHRFVAQAQPKVPQEIADKSSMAIWSYRRDLSKELGRPLTFEDKFMELDEEPIGPAPGLTHRWTYVFKERMKFLSHYFKVDSSSPTGAVMCVRPTAEVIDNLLHPEHRIRSLKDHSQRLLSALVENLGNHHVCNRLMHYFYDVWILQHRQIHYRGDLFGIEARKRGKFRNRAWYRDIDHTVDLLFEDPEFGAYWNKLLEKAKRVHSHVFGSHYVSWELIRRLRRGRFNFGFGMSLARHSTQSDVIHQIENPHMIEGLGQIGFGIWSRNSLRDGISHLIINALEEEVFNYRTGKVYETANYISLVRDKYATDTF